MAHFAQLLHGWNQLWWVKVLAYVTTAVLWAIAGFAVAASRRVPLTRRHKIAAACVAIVIVDEIVLLCLGSSSVFITLLNLSVAAALGGFARQARRRAAAG